MDNNLESNFNTNSLITVLKTIKPSWVGKKYSQSLNGVEKSVKASVTEAAAKVISVETAKDMMDVLEEVTSSTDLCIVPDSFINSVVDEQFTLVTENKLKALVGEGSEPVDGINTINGNPFAARLKRSVVPSKWLLIDCDNAPGMPVDLQTKSIQERLEYLEPIIPGCSSCERIELRSSSSRVTKDEAGPKSHAWIAVNRPDLIDQLRENVRVNMVVQNLYFDSPRFNSLKPWQTIAKEPRTVIDLSVWVSGRIVFNSKPQLEENMVNYRVEDAAIDIINEGAGCLDIGWVETAISEHTLTSYRQQTGCNLQYSKNNGQLSVQCDGLLKMDTEVEVKGVSRPLQDWLLQIPYGGKLRCEAPFRASQSEAAVIFKNDTGAISVYDVGNQTTYPLSIDSSIEVSKKLVPEKPIPVPQLELSGLLGEIARHAYDNSLYPSRSLATFTAFSAMSALCGYQFVAPGGLKLSQYSLVAMPTGTGKESQKNVILDVLGAFNKNYLITSFAASRQAMHENLTNKAIGQKLRNEDVENPTKKQLAGFREKLSERGSPFFGAISIEDEVHRYFNVGNSSHKSELRDLLLELYTATRFIWPVASMANKYVGFRAPAYSLHGFSTPGELAASLGDNASANGFVGRFLVYATHDRPVKDYGFMRREKPRGFKVPVEYEWLTGGHATSLTTPSHIKWAPGAQHVWESIDREEIEPMKEDQIHAEMGGRLGEQVIKLASLLAVNNAHDLVNVEITPLHIRDAWAYRKALHGSFLACMDKEGGIGRSAYAKTVEAATIAIRRYFKSNQGQPMPLSVLNKTCTDFRNLQSYQKDGVVKDLIDQGVIHSKQTVGRGSSLHPPIS